MHGMSDITGTDNPVWRVRLICCGRDDGDIFRDTWEEADQFRQGFTSGSGVAAPGLLGGHVRAGIIERIG